MGDSLPNHVFHITSRGNFAAALELGAYETESLRLEGFIHCSTEPQILRTAARFYRGQSGLVLLCIDAERLGDRLRYESADGEEFPHCYGPIPLESIPAVIDFPCRADGAFELPEELALLAR